jgi:hypothetical protein
MKPSRTFGMAVAVSDLAEAEEAYRRLGFTLTPGDPHTAGHGFRVDLATYSDLEIVSSGDWAGGAASAPRRSPTSAERPRCPSDRG